MPAAQDESGLAAAASVAAVPAEAGVRGVRSGVVDDEADSVAGAAAGDVGEALRMVSVVLKDRVAAGVIVARVRGCAGVIWRAESTDARRIHVRQIMIEVGCVGCGVLFRRCEAGEGGLRDAESSPAKNFYGGRDQPGAQF